MKKSIVLIAVLLTFSFAQTALGTIHEINVGDAFTPAGTTVMPGDTVRWILVSGTHSIVSDASSPTTFSSGELTTSGESFDMVFHNTDGSGPFPYHCGDHPAVVDTIFTVDTCYAGFDINGDGLPLTVADFVALLRMITDINAGTIPIPDTLYRADLNGDCVVDSVDLNIVNNYFIYGISALPPLPVATCCYPTVGPISCCIKRGDIDHNGTIDIADLIAMVEYAFGINTPPDLCPEEADVNGDGTVDMADIIRLVEFSFIINAPPPAPCYGN